MTLIDRLLANAVCLEGVLVDCDGVIVEASPAFALHVGVPVGDLPRRALDDFVAEHEGERLRDWCRPATSLPEDPVPVAFVSASGNPHTLWCLLERAGERLLLVGETRAGSEVPASHELMRLNNEMATLARESERRRRELERTRSELATTLEELQTSYWHLQKIQEVLPVCMGCGRVKAGEARWDTVAEYLRANEIFMSHGYCPPCADAVLREHGLEPLS